MLRISFSTIACAIALSLGLIGTVRADDTLVDNPAYQSWAKFKAGTLVKYSTDTNAMGNTTSMEMTQTLKDINADNATVEVKMSMVMGGNKTDMPATTQMVPAKIKKVDPTVAQTADAPKTETSTEDVQAAGKTFSCKKTSVTTDANGMTTKATTWTCDDIPGTMVKMESSSTGSMTMSSKMVLTDFEPQ
jgi:hypothetical protein